MASLLQLLPDVLDEWAIKSKASIYKTDPEAWAADVLGAHWWEKQREIAQSYVDNERTAVKSANGTGKSRLVADLICHWVSVYPQDEALAIISAPSIPQIERVIFMYLKNNYGYAMQRGTPLRGWINESLEWKYDTPAGNQFLAFGKRPADKDIVSTFQGTRKDRTAVFIDEAGGVPEDLYTAAEAVMTGSDSRFVIIGNPDKRGTEFFNIYTDPVKAQDWALHTISAFDLPTFTGEIVFPDEPEKQRFLIEESGMTNPKWVDHKRRAWGEGTARWQSKVLGEFPGEDDFTFFPQSVIDTAIGTDLDETEAPVILGADIARFGKDDTILYMNQGGKVRFVESWSGKDNITIARELNRCALELGAKELRVDAAGTGSGVFDALTVLDEFQHVTYEVIGILGANKSPNPNKWAQARSWHYDEFRTGMKTGKIDLDLEDKELMDELISQTYDFNNRNAIQISSKKDMKKAGLKSPDHLDAAIYATVNPDWDDDDMNGKQETYLPDEILEAYVDDDPFRW